MEVPPGRVERISDGGEEAIRAMIADLRAMKFNGLLKTSVFRGDTPSQGVLVLRGGDGVLAEHRSKVDVAGAPAVPEILKDAASDRAQLEVRTYDYGHSAISIDQLQRSYPEAAVKGLGDADQVLSKVLIQEAAERDAYLRDLEARREQEQSLVERVAKAANLEREYATREAAFDDREASIAAREESLERERRQMNDLYASLQGETEKISDAREVFDTRLADAERRERELILREQSSGELEGRLRQRDSSVVEREKTMAEREKAVGSLSKDLERREGQIASEAAALAKT